MDVMVIGGQVWSCPFSFCPTFGVNLRSSSALRSHVQVHLRHSRNECLTGRGLHELVHHLREQRRWLCGRCCKTYLIGSRCRSPNCGAILGASEGVPVFVPPGMEGLVLREEPVLQQVLTVRDDEHDTFRPFDDDSEVFKRLRSLAIPTLSFIPKSCRRKVAKSYADAIRAVNEVPGDLNR